MTTDDLLTVRECAALLHRQEGTVLRWCQTGRLAAHKHGRDWMIRRCDAETFQQPTGRGWGAYWQKKGEER